jgi:hypothetical protein
MSLPAANIPLLTKVKKSKLLYDWQFTANQLVLASSPLRLTTRVFFSTELLRQHSLWREDGCMSYEYACPFAKCTFRTYSKLFNYLLFIYQRVYVLQYIICMCASYKTSPSAFIEVWWLNSRACNTYFTVTVESEVQFDVSFVSSCEVT